MRSLNVNKKKEEFNPKKHTPPIGKEKPIFLKKKPFFKTKKRFEIPDAILETAKPINQKVYFIIKPELLEKEFNIEQELLNKIINSKTQQYEIKKINQELHIPYTQQEFFEELNKISKKRITTNKYNMIENPKTLKDLITKDITNLVNDNIKNLKIRNNGLTKFNILPNAEYLIENSIITKTNWDFYKTQKTTNEAGCLIIGSNTLINIIKYFANEENKLINDTLQIKKMQDDFQFKNKKEPINYMYIDNVATAIFESVEHMQKSLNTNSSYLTKIKQLLTKSEKHGNAIFAPLPQLQTLNNMYYFIDFDFQSPVRP